MQTNTKVLLLALVAAMCIAHASADAAKCSEDVLTQEYLDCVAESAKKPMTTAAETCAKMQAGSACSPSSCCEGDLGKESEASSQASFTALYPDDSCDIKCGAMNLQASIAFFVIALAAAAKNIF